MQTLDVVFRREALADLAEVYRYIARQGAPETAASYIQRLRDRCVAIGWAPNGGQPRDDFARGLRTVGFERRAVIAYTVERGRVRITNVFYGGRDFESLYKRPAAGD